jgi:undecaprenyl-diphosphatase
VALASVVQTILGKPVPSAIFLPLNGVMLYSVERRQRVRRKPAALTPARRKSVVATAQNSGETTIDFSAQPTVVIVRDAPGLTADRKLAQQTVRDALLIGASQSLALLPGISRSGITTLLVSAGDYDMSWPHA